jgi:hypothetical protein
MLDSDNAPLADPTYLFNEPDYMVRPKAMGAQPVLFGTCRNLEAHAERAAGP